MAKSGFDKVRDMRGDNNIDVGDGGSRITTGRGDDTITAGDGYDKIKAGGGDNQISVGDGGSSISTRGGDDTITAGDGFDRVSAGNGNNDIDVGDGGSFIRAGRGNDEIVSGDGYDFIFAGDGNNEIDAGDGGSFIKSGSGDDTITTGDGYDKIFAGNGDNEISTGDGGSFVLTGSGDDTIETGDGWDFVLAGNGNNQVNIGDGGGMVLTGSGDDNITIGDQGFAFVHTGSGDDRVTVQIDEHLCFAKLLGGNGVDTLVLDISLDAYKDDYFQAEMAYFLEHRAPDGRPFYFRSLNIYVHSFEQVEVVVDGVSLDPIDQDVLASDDAVTLSEDDGTVLFGSVVDNDDVPNGLAQVTLIQGPAAGVLELAPDGTFSFDPNDEFESLAEGEIAEVTFTYEVSDLDGDTSQAVATISIIGDNDAPFLASGTLDAEEDGATVDIDLSALGADVDSDDDGATLTYSVTGQPSEGSASISGTTLTFDPGADFQDLALGETRDVTIQVTAEDAHGATAVSTVTVTVTGANDAPTLAAALASADEDGATVDVDLAALGADVDSDDDGATLAYSVTGQPSEGSASISGTTLTFDPGADFQDLALGETRDVTIQVTAEDAHGATVVNTVTVTATGANDAPTLAAALASADEDGTSVDVDLAALGTDVDSDDDGATLTYSVTGQPSEGSASISGTTLTFDPGADFQDLALGETRDVTIQVTAEDAHGATAVNTVTVTATGANDAPTLAAALASADEDGATVDVDLAALGADVDSNDDGFTLTYSVTGQPNEGSASISGTTLTFDPGADFQDLALGETRDVTIQVTAEDTHGATAENTVTVTVTGGNDAPVFDLASSDVSSDLNVGFSQSGSFDAAALADLYTGTAPASEQTINGTEVFQVGAGNVTRLPHTNIDLVDAGVLESGDSVVINISGEVLRTGGDQDAVFGVEDGNGNLSFFTIDQATGALFSDVFESNGSAGIGFPDTPTSDRVNITGSGNPEVSTFSLRIVLDGAQDTITLVSGDGTPIGISTQPLDQIDPANGLRLFVANDQSGETFNYVSLDYDLEVARLEDNGTLNFNDVDVSDTHIASIQDVRLTGNANGLDIAGATTLLSLTVNSTTALAAGSVDWSFAADDADYAYLALGESLLIEYDVQIDDGNGGTALETVSVRINGVNDAPVAVNDTAGTGENTAITVDVLANDTDADLSDTHTVDAASVTSGGGSVAVVGNQVEWTPGSDYDYLAQGETATVEIAYEISDNNGGTATGTLTVTVTGDNDGPTLSAGLGNATEDGGSVDIDLAALGGDVDSDDDGATLTYSVTSVPGEGSASIAGSTLTFDPGADFQDLALGETRDVTIQVTAEDAHGATAVNTVTVTVTGTNDAPVAQAISGDVAEEGSSAEAFSLGIADSSTVPNAGLFYVLDYESQSLTEVFRAVGTIDTPLQAAQSLNVTNGMVLSLNGNNADWGAVAASIVDGVDTWADPNLFELSGYTGSMVADPRGFVLYRDSVSNATLTISVPDVETPDGPTTYEISAEIISFQDNRFGNIDVGAVQFTSVPQPAPDTVTVSADFSDVDTTDTHSFSVDTTGTQGEVTNNGDGTFTYSANGAFDGLAEGETTTDTFTYTVTDDSGAVNASTTETATITITGINDVPTLAAGNLAANEDGGAVNFDLSTIGDDVDSDDDGSTLSYYVSGQTGEGSASISGATLTFNPGSDFQDLAQGETRDVVIQVTAEDAHGATVVNDVTVTVTGVNDAPTLADALSSADEDGATVDVDLAALGADADGDDDGSTLTYTVTGNPSEGSASISGATLTFDPGADFQDLAVGETRDVSIQVTAEDANGATAVNTVTMTVTGTNDAPVAAAVTANVDENGAGATGFEGLDGAYVIPNLGRWWIADYDAGTLTSVARTSSTLQFDDVAPTNGVVFTLNPNAPSGINWGAAATSYSDGVGSVVDPASIQVEGFAGTPFVSGDFLSVDGTITNGTVRLSVADVQTPDGPATFDFTVNGVDNPAPGAAADTLHVDSVELSVTPQPVTGTVVVAASFTDVDVSDTHSFSVDSSATTGVVTNNGDGTFTYNTNGAFEHLAVGETATDSFTYTVDDGNGGTSTETATITVIGQNDAPAAAAIDAGTVDEDSGSQTIDLLANATDIDGDTLSVSGISVVDDMGVALSFTDNGDGTISIDPIQYGEDLGQGESRVVTVSYDIEDGNATVSNTATMTVNGITNNIAPTAQDTSVAPEGAGFVFDENPVVTSQQVSETDLYQNNQYQYDANGDSNAVVVAFGEGGYAVAWRERDGTYSGSTLTARSDQIAVQLYGPDDQPVGAKMLFGEIDTTNSNDTDVDRAYEYNPRLISMQDGGFALTWEGDYRSYTGTTQTQYERDIYVQLFDSSGAPTSTDPIKASQTVSVTNGTTTAYDAFQDFLPDIAALADGGVALSWRGNHYDSSGSTFVSNSREVNVYVRAFDADGTPRGAEVSLGSDDRSRSSDDIDRHYDSNPRIAASDDGSFAVVWYGNYNNYTGTTYTGSSNDVFMQLFDADGAEQGGVIQVSQTVPYQSGSATNDAYSDNSPEITALANGGYVVAWSGRHSEYSGSSFVSSEDNIWVRVYDADGQAVSAELSLGEVDQSYSADSRDRAQDYNPKVAATADGGFVVTWYGNYYGYNGTTVTEYTQEIYVQRFDANGDALAAAQQISQTGARTTGTYQVYDSISDSDPQITDLLGGGFVVSWYSNQQTYNGSTFVESQQVIQAQRFDEEGNAVGDVITLGNVAQDANGYDRSQDSQARITALNDGGFAITWYNYTNFYTSSGSYAGYSNDVFVAAVHASGGGTELTDPVDVDVANLIDDADIPDGDQLTVTVATGSNGSTATVNGTVVSLLPNAAYYAALGKDETEDETFTYTVTDLAGAQATATITLTVTGNNDKPEANAISGATDEDGPATTLTADFTDVDTNDTHTYSVNTADTLGVVTNNGDGTFDYDPNGAFEALAAGETTTDTFKYTVRDAAGKSSTATATVTITGENDAPTAQAAAISNGYVFAETPETNQQKVSLTDQYQSGSQTRDANYDDQPRVISFGDGGYAVAWRQRDETYSGSTRIDSEDQVAVQIYDADHNKVGGIQTFGEIDQSYSNDNLDRSYDNQISMTELDTGGFAMSWYGNYRSYSGTTLTRYERDIYVQIFDENGAPTSTDPIKVSETAYGTNGSNPNYDIFGDFEPAITSLVDGGIAVTWRTDEYGLSGTTLNTSIRDNQIKVQAYDTDGTARGPIAELGSIDRSYSRDSIDRHYEYEPRIAASDDGGFAVVWRGYYSDYSGTTTIGRDEDVYLQVFDADGVAQGGTTKVSQTVDYTSGSFTGDAHRDYEPEITALANGNYAVTWRGDHATYSGSTLTSSEQNVYVRVFDSSGQPVSQEVSVGSVGTSYSNDDRDRHYDYNPEITATEDGGFVVAWYGDYYTYSGTTQTSYERDVWVQRFDEDGTALGDAEKISQTVPRQSGTSDYDSFQDYNPVVTGLEGGGYVVVWESNQETYNGTTFVSSERLIQAQRFDVEGKKAGDVIDLGRVSRDGNGYDRAYDSAPKVSALEGGGFAVTWQNSTDLYNSNGTYAGNERDVYVAAIQPIGNGSLANGVVVDVADKIDDIDLAGGDTLTVTVDAVGSNGSTATANGTEITISPNLSHYAPLAKGETAEETFTYTVTDASGAQASATLTFTARGENDAPVVESVTYSALDSGTIAFSDVDNGDTHTVAATDATITGDASALAGIDVFDFISFDAVDQAGDTVDWTINVPSAAQSAVAAALADGETLTIDYTVGVSDEEEDVAQTTVSITLDGDGFLI